MLKTIRAYLADHPIQVRTAVAAVLVLVGQYVPAVQDFAGSETAVDLITGALVAFLAGDAVRVTNQNKR